MDNRTPAPAAKAPKPAPMPCAWCGRPVRRNTPAAAWAVGNEDQAMHAKCQREAGMVQP